jgi:hypothetical protein
MALQFINVGQSADDGQGDPIRTAYQKINSNFLELFSAGSGGIVDNVYYVSKSGNDGNAGNSLSQSFASIRRAVDVANQYIFNFPGTRVSIFVKAGTYTEPNPISCSPGINIIGDGLRAVSVIPQNPTLDIFWVRSACYLTGMTFRGHLTPSAAVAYPQSGAGTITTSPYVQNCSSITTTGAGMRVDGNLAGGLKSMVSDAYTQVNEGGIGVHLLNQGYAQLVSIFTVCCNEGILVESGAYCSITNSNTSFGTFGLVARGQVALPNSGLVDGANQSGQVIALRNLTAQPTSNQSVSFDNGATYSSIWEATPLSEGQSVITVSDPVVVPYADGTPVSFHIRSAINASSHTFEWVGTGDSLANALPATGAMPVQANEVLQLDGGVVVFTSTDQRGDFRIGDQLTINGTTGTISGDTFNKSLFAVITPYVLAIEG